MNEADFLGFVSKTLNKPEGSIAMGDDAKALGWDSLADLELVAHADEAWGIVADADQLGQCVTVGDIWALLSNKTS